MGIFGLGKPNIKKFAEGGNIKGLMKALSHRERDIRMQAIEALGTMKQVEAVEPLIMLFGDKDFRIRENAAEALGKIGEPAVDMLLIALNNESKDFRSNACEALGKIKDKRAVEPLINALKDNDEEVRKCAASALGEINDDRAVEPLINALEDNYKWVGAMAAWALGEINDDRAVEPLIKSLNEWKGEELRSFARGSVSGHPGRTSGLEALGKFRHPKITGILISYINDEHPLLAYTATKVLGEIGDSSAVEPLIKALKDPRRAIRIGAAQALGLIGDEKSTKSLRAAADDKDADVRKEIKKALKKIEKLSQKKGAKKISAHAGNDFPHGMENAEMRSRKKSGPIGDFETDCVEPQYVEDTESRRFDKPPEVRVVASLGNSDRYKDVIRTAKELLKKYPDFDYLYYWMGTAFVGDGDLSGARKILMEGLRKAKSKAYLCLKLGDAELKAKDAKKALKWWCQSIHCHQSNSYDLDNSPYLYLAAIAGAYGLKWEHDAFNLKAHSIRDADLSYNAMSAIQDLFVDQKTEAIVSVVKKMAKISGLT